MRKNKYIVSFIVFIVCIFTLNTVKAVEIFDSKATTEVYKLSEDDSSFKLPFVRFCESRMEIDKEIAQIGMFFSNSSIDINSVLKESQILFSNDTVRINSDMEDVIVFSSNNVIVNAKVENLIVFAGTSITIDENGNIGQNIITYTPQLTVNGNVDGNILGYANDVIINSIVNGEVRLSLQNLEFGEEALLISGININTSNANITVPEDIGTSTIDIVQAEEKTSVREYIINILYNVIRNLVAFALILIFIKSDKMEKMTQNLTSDKVVKKGLLGYIFALACIIFGISLGLYLLPEVGLSAFIMGIAMLVVFTLIKNIVVGTFIANLTKYKYMKTDLKLNSFLVATTSFLMLELLESIPYVGAIIKFIVFIFAIGIVLTALSKPKVEEKLEQKEESKAEVVDNEK